MSGYDYEFLSKVSEEYICSICELPMRKPVQTDCGHRFCRECLLKANKGKRVSECPMDRQPLYMKKVFHDKALERSILPLIIECPKSKCDWQGELGNLEDHKPKCDYWIIECTLCGVNRLVKEMEVHNQEECEWREVSCPHCGKMVISWELKKHNDFCPECPVECPNQCGQKIKRAKAEDHMANHCPKWVVLCTYKGLGCEFECPRENLKKHLENEANDHLSLVLKHSKQFQEKMTQRCDCIERNTRNFKGELREINRELDKHQRKYDILTSKLEDTEKQTQLLIENSIKIKSGVELEREHVRRALVSIAIPVIGMIAILTFTLFTWLILLLKERVFTD